MNTDKITRNDTIETDFLKVKGNLISWKDTIVQISNVSMISTANVAKMPFPIFSLVIILLGLIIFKMSEIASIGLIVAGAIWMFIWHTKNDDLQSMTKLVFILNSGSTHTLVFNNKEFLEKVISVLSEILTTC